MDTFTLAVERFRDFLINQGCSLELLWIFQDDVLEAANRIWLRWPLGPHNLRLSEEEYERGVKIGCGVGLQTYCVLDSHICCFVNVAEDPAEASQMMMSGLKLSMLENPSQAMLVRQSWQWRILGLLAHKSLILPHHPKFFHVKL